MKKFLILSVAFAFVMSMIGVVGMTNAASLTSVTVDMTRQQLSTVADYTVEFTTPTGIAATETITLTFGAGFNVAAITDTDVDVADDTVDYTDASDTCAVGAEDLDITVAGQVMTIEFCAAITAAAGSVMEIEIGSHATGGANQITNPATAGSHTITIGGTMVDGAEAAVPILDNDFVTINADVQGAMEFDLDAPQTDDTTDCNDAGDDEAAPYVVDLGTLDPSAVTTSADNGVDSICVDDIKTTATGGAVIYVQSTNQGLDSSSSGDSIDNAGTGNLVGGTDGYGICVSDEDVTDMGAATGTLVDVAPFAGTCDSTVGGHNVGNFDGTYQAILNTNSGPMNSGGGWAQILVKASIDATTASATDYTDTLYFKGIGTY